MAQRLVKWTLDNTTLKMVKPLENATGEIVAEFDLTKLFETFPEMTEVQQQTIAYGVKQKLSDKGASEVGSVGGKVTQAKETWKILLEGKWTGERMNATGASENKKILANLKEVASTVTLQGLLAKQLAFPDKFTAEDQAKLNEFLLIMAQNAAK